ncbi:Zinc finger, GATA-type [Sesbania bispinosa]|nr:Zinc finger, GATA-type [Sesbania bispinosa]
MDSGKSNQARDFDLNIPFREDLDLEAENQLIHINTPPASQISTDDINITAAKNENEVHESSAVEDTTPALANPDDTKQVRLYVSSLPGTGGGFIPGGRRRYHRRGAAVLTSDPDRFCTNYYCKTRKTPLWRKGPLGPKTLCNACGIYYVKHVKSRGSGIPQVPIEEGDASSSSAANDGAGAPPTSVPAATDPNGSSNF